MGSCCKRIVVHLPGVDFFGLTGGPRWRRQPGGIGESPRWCRPSGGNSARLGTLVPWGSCCRLAAGARPRADKKIRGGGGGKRGGGRCAALGHAFFTQALCPRSFACGQGGLLAVGCFR